MYKPLAKPAEGLALWVYLQHHLSFGCNECGATLRTENGFSGMDWMLFGHRPPHWGLALITDLTDVPGAMTEQGQTVMWGRGPKNRRASIRQPSYVERL